jgi:protein involved in polysaccharide export with SLBB domain
MSAMTVIAIHRNLLPALLVAIAALNSGCAAVSNPVSDGIPVRYLPKEVLGRAKKDLIPVPLTLLRLPETKKYLLDKNDMLAVIAGDMFGPENIQPPVSLANPLDGTQSSVGYPLPVREDGTISLPNPKIKPIMVKGLSPEEVEEKLRRVLTQGEDNLGPDSKPLVLYAPGSKISVQLLRKRRYSVFVVRDDSQGIPFNAGGGILQTGARRLGQIVTLEAGRNDVFNALNSTGGPPGLDARNEVEIQRGQYDPADPRKGFSRIPLKIYKDQPLNITQSDITLNDGDIVTIPGRETELYLIGGIVLPRQVALPRDYDLDVVQAIIVGNGPIASGGFVNNQFVGNQVSTGLGSPSPAQVNILRQLPDGQQLNIRVDLTRALQDPRENILVQPNDRIIMQEKPYEALTRYMTQTFRFNILSPFIRATDLSTTLNANLP